MTIAMKLIDRFERAYDSWACGTYFYNNYVKQGRTHDEEGHPLDNRVCPVNRVRFVYEWIITRRAYLYGTFMCRWFGHGAHYHDESWAGRDSGGVAGYCDRCGFSFEHTYY